jgi:translocation and assembly module TamB
VSRPPDRIDPTMGTPGGGGTAPPPGGPPPRRPRFYRRKRFWQWSGGAVALGVIGVLFAVYWLLQTVAGRDVLLAQVIARLPAGSSFTWGSAEGPVAGPLTLREVDFRFDQIHFTAKRVTLDPDLRPLLGKRLRLDVLEIEDAALSLPPSAEEPFKLPHWPDVLPAIELPLNIQADTLVVDGFRVSQDGKQVIDVRRARGGIDIGDGYVHAERLAVDWAASACMVTTHRPTTTRPILSPPRCSPRRAAAPVRASA